MKEYKVWVSIRGGYYTTIDANSANEAEEIVLHDVDLLKFEELEYWSADVEVI